MGGFGGADGLRAWLQAHHVQAVIDATHPFAYRMPFNAAQAVAGTSIARLRLLRNAWQPQQGDAWHMADSHPQAVQALGSTPRRVFLTIGRQELAPYAAAPQHFYVVRSIDPVTDKILPNALWLTQRPPFDVPHEHALLQQYGIDVLVSKNSGGSATAAKLQAARAAGCDVIMLQRPANPAGACVATAAKAWAWVQG